ncbi:MAG: ATP-dependent DNA helicase RecG, partial [bacterium]
MRDLDQIQAQYVKGVGPGRAEMLRRLGIRSVNDLLRHYPRRYEDRRQIRRIAQLETGRNETVRGKVLAVGTRRLRRALILVQVVVGDGSGTVYATWFNQPYMQSRFKVGQELILTGKVQRRGYLEILSPEFEIMSAQESALLNAGRIVPVYPLGERLSQRAVRKIIHSCLDGYAASVPELLETSLREECGLCPISDAIKGIHFPESPAALEAARKRLVFDEFLPMQLAIHLKRRQLAEIPGSSKKGGEVVRRFLESLPFKLTRAQERVIAEIRADMERAHPMNRLLQGDVGSGKTIVAIVALLIALDSGYQGVIMAPTEILAEQHWRTLDALLSPLGIRPYLLTGEMGAAEKNGVYEAIRLSSPLIQHKFGVSQRAAIKSKGENPDFMVMTATPIPRTLALTLYGDLDVSVIDEMPPGRGSVTTRWVPPEKMGEAYAFIRAEALKGRQAYIIYPLIEENEKLPLSAASSMAASLSDEHFHDLRVGLIHGRLDRGEREELMRDFRAGRIQVLVATSVIEVGLDVPG